MDFEIIGPIRQIEMLAAGNGVRIRKTLIKKYGRGRWRKLKGLATVRLRNGSVRKAELHWYQAHGIGKREFKIKYLLDDK